MRLEGKFKGAVRFTSVEVEEVLTRRVGSNNESSGKVTVPIQLVGKEIIVLIPKKAKK